MPSKNRNKVYKKNAYYHAYNRGVDKRKIFMDEQDYTVFLYLLKYYLSPPKKDEAHPLANTSSAVIRPRPIKNLHQEIDLIAFCLMPNHFHLLIKQITINGMTKLLHNLLTIYSMYFNRRHKRTGHLFQGRYKAVLVDNDEYLLYLSGYIHLNPAALTGPDPVRYPYSSFGYYLGNKTAKWIKPKSGDSYRKIVMDYLKEKDPKDPKENIGKLSID